jgi:hypothetical protein
MECITGENQETVNQDKTPDCDTNWVTDFLNSLSNTTTPLPAVSNETPTMPPNPLEVGNIEDLDLLDLLSLPDLDNSPPEYPQCTTAETVAVGTQSSPSAVVSTATQCETTTYEASSQTEPMN